MQGEREDPCRERIGARQPPPLSERAVLRKRMDRRIVDARLDPSLFHCRSDSISIDRIRENDYGQMVGRDPLAVTISKRHRQPINAVQCLAIAAGDPRPGLVLLNQARKLDEAHRRPNLVEPVVEPGQNDVVA